MTLTTIRPARIRVMRRPGSHTSHVFRACQDTSVCDRIRGGRLEDVPDHIATCGACVDSVTAGELGQLVRAERRAQRGIQPDQADFTEVSEVLAAAQLRLFS